MQAGHPLEVGLEALGLGGEAWAWATDTSFPDHDERREQALQAFEAWKSTFTPAKVCTVGGAHHPCAVTVSPEPILQPAYGHRGLDPADKLEPMDMTRR